MLSTVVIILGLLLAAWAAMGITETGFYVSGRGDPGQLEGGTLPTFLIIGLLMVLYGIFEKVIRK